MPIRRPSPAVLSIIALLLVASSAVVRGQSENSLVCSEDTRVTRDQNGDLVYGSLPPTDPPQTEEYSPQGLEAWYSLARHFVDGVQGITFRTVVSTAIIMSGAQTLIIRMKCVELFISSSVGGVFTQCIV